MTDLSLNILDIANNSTRAGAKNICISVSADTNTNLLSVMIADDGCGMDSEFLKTVTDPFATTRTTRKVGLGIPLFKMAAQQSGGEFRIDSVKGKGTRVFASFLLDSIDRPPLGNLASTVSILLGGAPDTDFIFKYSFNSNDYTFNTKEVRQMLGDDAFYDTITLNYLKDMIEENLETVNGGIII